MEIHLEKLTWDTVDAVLKLRVSKEQKGFVAPNSDSIIDAYFALTEEGKNVFPFGIYNGKKAVGFLMIGYHCAWRENLDFAKKQLLYLALHDRQTVSGERLRERGAQTRGGFRSYRAVRKGRILLAVL